MRSIVSRNKLIQSFHQFSRFKHITTASSAVSRLRSTTQTMSSKDTPNVYKHTHSYIQVLGNGTDTGDTTPSVLLFFDSYRYVFNVGEGFQRYCFQHRLKIGKLTDVFLTRMSTEAAGGLPGLFITMTDSHGLNPSSPVELHVHGPMKLKQYLNALKTFVSVPMDGMAMSNFGSAETAGVLEETLVANDQVEIRPILLLPQKSTGRSSPNMFLEKEECGISNATDIVPCACYVCQLADTKGKFMPEKAQELGICVGPDFAKLISGICVMGENGNVVHPHQVMEPTIPGPTLIIVDCPDDSYTASLFSATGFDQYFQERERDLVIVHLGSHEVVASKAYEKWMQRFPASVQHIFVNERAANATTIMRNAAIIQSKLNLVDEIYFPLPKTIVAAHAMPQPKGTISGKDLLRYHLKPVGKKGVDSSQLQEPFDLESVVTKFKDEHPSVLTAIEEFREKRRKHEQLLKNSPRAMIDENELEITFLGTGSAIPSKYRNVTGIYLDFFEKGSMMLDCGEGSYGQLVRRFGREGAAQAVKKLLCIWISHIHADHHIGLPTILRQRRKLLGPQVPPLLIIGPPMLYSTIRSYGEIEAINFEYVLALDSSNHSPTEKKAKIENRGTWTTLSYVKTALNLQQIESFSVEHCAHAYGVSLVSNTGWKVVFSGDTVPCASVITHAKDATLLIHEATFEEDMEYEALLKKHSTTKDAVRIATETNAYRTILTHFSQRYPKIPIIEADAEAGICVAFDLMSVNLSDLEMLPYTIKPCQGLFREEQGEIEAQESSLEPINCQS